MYLAIGALLGFAFGVMLKHSAFAAKNGASIVVSLLLATVVWMISVMAFAIYAETQLGAKSQPSWVGLAAWFAAIAFFLGVKRK